MTDEPPVLVVRDRDRRAGACRSADGASGRYSGAQARGARRAGRRGACDPRRTEPGPDVGLTPRELDVLALIAEGASNKAIARRLAISVHTVKFHIASLLDKLDAQGRAEAVAQGARLGAIRL